ncbi:hypothetical protein HUN59_05325 [Curtobacterium sp. Csp2]|uniref:hypothetical protein n=1 Tax=Curtobacterium sp. Csp2 TaxID=2495430 RepID=UPI00158063CE|nr:hypothetical protein [Curtobacterium sp. Csp2]QKS15718.1 hypothetical protein HUN59_05325 [Curtobacterium sp. Csp2]
MMNEPGRKPSWALSSVDDPNPYYPHCDRCNAFARWSIGEFEDDHPEHLAPIIRYFACGRHIAGILTTAHWLLDALMIYDLTKPAERS